MREEAPPSRPAGGPSGGPRRSPLEITLEQAGRTSQVAAFLVRERSAAVRYGIALLVTLLSGAATVLLAPNLERVTFLILWPAVIFSALVGGVGPAVLSSVLAVTIVDTYLLEPRGALIVGARDVPQLAVFLLLSLGMSTLASALRAARVRGAIATERLEQLALELEDQATELEQQLEESQAVQEELEQTSEELSERTREAEAAGAFSRGILGSITDPFVVHDDKWRFVYINEQAASVFTLSPRAPRGSLIGVSLWDAFPDIVGTEHERQMRRAATERVPVTCEAFYAQAGTWSVMSCYPLPDGGLATQWRDVTDRRRAEESARYLARASEILGGSLDYETTLAELAHVVVPELAAWCAVYVVDGAGEPRQVALAHADEKMVTWARELNRRYPPDPAAPEGVHTVIRNGEPVLLPEITDEMLVAGARDAEHLELVRTLRLRSAMMVPLAAHGRVLGALALYSDVSGRSFGPAELELATELARRAALAVDNAMRHRAERTARRAADDANNVKLRFLATMSHELRTPLNAIGGYAELMRLGLRGPVTPTQLKDLERIGNSQRSLLGLINDILNFAKVDAGHVEFATTDVDIAPLLRDLEDAVRPQLLAARLEFHGPDCKDGLMVRGDAEKIRQIVLNLLTNAIKFTQGPGTVSIRCMAAAGIVRVDVADTGIGIAADRLDSVFDPFVQLDRTLTSQHEGTGLGLAISRDLARAMKGDITATSEPGRGSVFSLVLPAC